MNVMVNILRITMSGSRRKYIHTTTKAVTILKADTATYETS